MQLRIDFRFFSVGEVTLDRRQVAQCNGERLVVNGLDFELCGNLNNQHGKRACFFENKEPENVVPNSLRSI